MNKDDILAKSREENRDRDLYAHEINNSASAISSFVSLFMATIFFVLQKLIKQEFNLGLYALVFSYGATNFIVKAVHMKRKRDIVLSIIYIIATLTLTVAHISQLIATSAI
jgi:uncharacterized membrane protein YhaH (DUF805 family)